MERGNTKLKFFDKYLGPLLLLALTPLRLFRTRQVPKLINSVALLKTAAIGDTVLLSAAITDLRVANPDMKIVLFTGASNFEFAKLLSGADQIVKLPLTNPFACVKIIRSHQIDIFIDFDSWPRISALLAALSRAKIRIGFNTSQQYRHFMQDIPVPHRNDQHELENYRDLLRVIGLNAANLPQQLQHSWKEGGNTIVFHMWPSGTQSHLKEWPAEKWHTLANELLLLGNYSFVLTGGREDISGCDAFLATLPASLRTRFISHAGASFSNTLSLLQQAALLVSVNTGIMHVGAAMGVPTVGLHGPTDPRRWGPVGPRTRSVVSKSKGAGTLNLGFEYTLETDYMSGIDDSDVINASRELLYWTASN
ncbi:hypothetical protein BZG29_26670 [Janthinobacterium sp. LM6]|uniref:glycosyltransferase family 9 protein n=1 Tax=Janthinobacterium sp. LM6 TaxID=1938606 RepID=UPI000983D90E|nr:glycosyltransferase family 9 protein [Janthinobacterium sp. LM6]AQR71507.1 hypothetical protein BZG29_26670 [Janthinobacterium sp. LM6]